MELGPGMECDTCTKTTLQSASKFLYLRPTCGAPALETDVDAFGLQCRPILGASPIQSYLGQTPEAHSRI